MRTYLRNCCSQNIYGGITNQSFNIGSSPISIFNRIGNFGCCSNGGFLAGLGFGFGFGLTNLIGSFMGRCFTNMPFGMFSNMSFLSFANNYGQKVSQFDRYERYKSKSCDCNCDCRNTIKDNEDKNITPTKPIENKDDNADLDPKIKDEMDYIAKDALKKYLKKGSFEIKDLLIERVDAVITSIDFSGIYNMKKGVKNDYRNENGDIVRVADGTVVTMKFTHNNKEYTVKIHSDKVPRKGKTQNFVEKQNLD